MESLDRMEIIKASDLLKKSFEEFLPYFEDNKETLLKKDKISPLLLKCFKYINSPTLIKLIDFGFQYDFTIPDTKMSFLQTLIVNEEIEKATVLVVKYKFKNIDFVHKDSKQTALMMASYMNSAKLGQALLFKGADPTLRDINGLTALH